MYTNISEPDYPAALGIISHLNSDELKDMLNDDTKFEELMKDVKQFKDLETEKEMIMASNRSLAEFNLAKEPQLEEGKQRLQNLSEKGEVLCKSVERKIAELRSKTADLSLDTTLALLQTSAAESEEESEAIAEKFLEGELEIDGFLEQFSVRRKLMHLRRVKADKMVELLAEKHRQSILSSRPTIGAQQPFGSVANYIMQPFNLLPSGDIDTAPYPVSGVNMPIVPMPMPMPMPGPYRGNV